MTIAKSETRLADFGYYQRPSHCGLVGGLRRVAQIEIEFLTQFIPDDGVILDCGSHVAFIASPLRAHPSGLMCMRSRLSRTGKLARAKYRAARQ